MKLYRHTKSPHGIFLSTFSDHHMHPDHPIAGEIQIPDKDRTFAMNATDTEMSIYCEILHFVT